MANVVSEIGAFSIEKLRFSLNSQIRLGSEYFSNSWKPIGISMFQISRPENERANFFNETKFIQLHVGVGVSLKLVISKPPRASKNAKSLRLREKGAARGRP